jgi:hypothetical protein
MDKANGQGFSTLMYKSGEILELEIPYRKLNLIHGEEINACDSI